MPNTKTHPVQTIHAIPIIIRSKTIQIPTTSQKHLKLTPISIKNKKTNQIRKRENIKTIKTTLLSRLWYCRFKKKNQKEILINYLNYLLSNKILLILIILVPLFFISCFMFILFKLNRFNKNIKISNDKKWDDK